VHRTIRRGIVVELRLSAVGKPDVSPAKPARLRSYGAPLLLTLLGVATLGLNDIRIAGQPVADIAFVLATGMTMIAMLAGDTRKLAPARMRRSPHLMVIGTLVVLTMGTLASVQAINIVASLGEVLRFGWVTIVWFWLLRAVVPDVPALVLLIRAFKATVLLNAAAALLGSAGILDLNAGEFYGSRQTAFYSHPNMLGVLLAVGLPYFVVEMPAVEGVEPQATWKRFLLGGIVVGAIGATGSMGAFGGAAIGLAIAFAVSKASRPVRRRRSQMHPLTIMSFMLLALGGLVWLVQSDSPVVERFSLFRSGDSGVNTSVESRNDFNEFAINRLDDSMIVGVGLDLESATYHSGLHIGLNHNMYLSTLYRVGLPAVVGLCLILVAALRQVIALVRATRTSDMHGLAVAAFASLTTACLIAVSQPTTHERSFWFAVAVVPVITAVFRHRVMSPGGDLDLQGGFVQRPDLGRGVAPVGLGR
jgi:O-antigen ligase